jgi:hypothetical protein
MSPRKLLIIVVLLIAIAPSSYLLPATAADDDTANSPLAQTLSRLLRDAVPSEYEKQKDWGAMKQITVGIRPAGKLSDPHLKRRKKTVNHGVWKHYKLRLIEPEKNLVVQIWNLRSLPSGRMGFTVHLEAKLDAWSRAKVYEYGVHIISLEMESDALVKIDLAGEVGLQVTSVNGSPALAVQPSIKDAHLTLADFHLRRVSNARGPIIHELGAGLKDFAEDEINGPQLADKLNRAIDQKRDRLTFTMGDWIKSPWLSLSPTSTPQTAAVQKSDSQ